MCDCPLGRAGPATQQHGPGAVCWGRRLQAEDRLLLLGSKCGKRREVKDGGAVSRSAVVGSLNVYVEQLGT